MSYGIYLAALVASTLCGVDAELCQRLASLWRQIAELVVSFFGPRGLAVLHPAVRT